ncbi:MAG: UDP-N-acetylmuramate--L-alanine ligase [Bacteroidales bacterium]|nr:UDP-N-acetylmuramate--L-alanine ligase [Bacteroidales bacterium]
MNKVKIIISGGGTGGHVFPAIAIANALKEKINNLEILFIGAKGKIEMEKIPAQGYKIIGLNISGFHRSLTAKNLSFPFKLILSIFKAKKIIKSFKPDLVIGVGGYASGPTLRVAGKKNIPVIIQEQNSYPGITNKLLAKYAKKIFVAYEGMDKYFDKDKIIIAGNPVRQSLAELKVDKTEALKYFNLAEDRKTILIVGGSQGARTINESIYNKIKLFNNSNYQLIWQTGKYFYDTANELINSKNYDNIKIFKFITKMDYAYAVADLVVSRAGAISISEICAVKKPAIFVPYPFAAEDHQTKNAMALINKNAAVLIPDRNAKSKLADEIIELISNENHLLRLSENISKLSFKNSAEIIAEEVKKILNIKSINLQNIKNVYFLGIGGIGMSALARYFNAKNIIVSGYDKTQTALTDNLTKEGIEISFEDDIKNIPKDIDLVIYTPAIPKENAQYQYFIKNNYALMKRSEVLGLLTKDIFTIAIAGTHGKTSITSLTAHILKKSGLDITAFIGGICNNYNSNLIISEKNEMIIVEADEFDKSFLSLYPDIAVISSIDADHLDIYKDRKSLTDAFSEFANQIKPDGTLIINKKIDLKCKSNKITYSLDENSDIYAKDIIVKDNEYNFNLKYKEKEIKDIKIKIPGRHNIENAVAAAGVAYLLNIDKKDIKTGIESFKGVKRRFEYILKTEKTIFIDDYAHHPNEIKACIKTVKELYPGKKITGIFQPHLFSRTKYFADEFAESLEPLDNIILLDIYPAREKPIKGINSEMLLKKIENNNKCLMSVKEILNNFKDKKPEVIITIGAGDIDKLIEPLKNVLI